MKHKFEVVVRARSGTDVVREKAVGGSNSRAEAEWMVEHSGDSKKAVNARRILKNALPSAIITVELKFN